MPPPPASSSRNPLALAFLLSVAPLLHAIEWQPVMLNAPEGPYSKALWKADWPGCAYEDGISEGHVTLVKKGETAWLRVLYPKGSHGGPEGGAGWRYPLGVKADRPSAELRYTVLFEEGFDFVKGGKLPGLCGGPKTITGGDKVTGDEGWSARIMWRRDGRGQAYVYHMNQPSKYGDEFDFPEEVRFIPGQPAQLRLRVTMNTIGQRDGTLRVWIRQGASATERLVVEKTDMQWRSVPSIGADSILFNTFHGGSDVSWAPSRDCHARFSGFEWR